MSSPKTCCHTIQILNFPSRDTVTYPIVRVVGLIQCKESKTCLHIGKPAKLVLILQNQNIEKLINIKNQKFKILLQLSEGRNKFEFKFDSQTLTLSLDYCPSKSEYTVMPMYVICEGHDGKYQAPSNVENDVESACNRILLCSRLLQCFTAEKLLENGLGRKTFTLENKCQVFKSKVDYLDARRISQEKLWESIGRDIMNSKHASEKKKYLAFLSCTNYNGYKFSEETMKTHEDILGITEAYVALGGGGLALFGTACLYTWAEEFDEVITKFEDSTVVDKMKFLDDSCYRGTQGSCFSTTLGSVLHELYHTFDLGHTKTGVMGRGFDNISKFFTFEDDDNQEEHFKAFQAQIEFKEEFESDMLSERLHNESKRKDFQVIKKIEDNDWTVLTKSCAVILAYHKWFNNYCHSNSITLSYDFSSKFIQSTAGIRVVEIRKQPDEMIMFNWTFEGKVLKFSFRIPDEALKSKISRTIFVEDNLGNILKKPLSS
ncbi:unnamed protein product [Ceutorhynchus assimilis]|uniref:Zinc metalloproteinase n=1 Tax=Ceutorhynchus assimilis TaxID=467358 RepID=A0A9P0DIP3_9CUCU|nr:unnamed protein product [Ceutorhynchus assimilis]